MEKYDALETIYDHSYFNPDKILFLYHLQPHIHLCR